MSKKFGSVTSNNFKLWGASSAKTDSFVPGKVSKASSYASGEKCTYSHPALPIKVGDIEYHVYGGSCSTPMQDDCDIYVALDWNTTHDTQAYPWNNKRVFVSFPIQDMSTPKDAIEFKNMIEWLAAQIIEGKKVHVGCLGGHGRTGMVLAALVKTMTGNEDAVTYVRDNYCKKVVETAGQSDFLKQHFGIKRAKGAKDSFTWDDNPTYKTHYSYVHDLSEAYGPKAIEVKPVKFRGNIWGIDSSYAV